MGEAQDSYLLIQMLGFTTGTALFLVLIALSWKSRRTGDGTFNGLLASVGGLLWNVGNVAKYGMLTSGIPYQALPVQLADAIAYTGTAILPTAIMLMLRSPTRSRPAQPRASRALRFASYTIAVLLSLAFFAALVPGFPLAISDVMKLSAYNLALHVITSVKIGRAHV